MGVLVPFTTIAGHLPGPSGTRRMQLHSNGYYPYDRYVNMDFTVLELHIDEGGPTAEQLFPVHKEILAKKPLIIWGNLHENDLHWIFRNLPGQVLAVITCVNSPGEAPRISSR